MIQQNQTVPSLSSETRPFATWQINGAKGNRSMNSNQYQLPALQRGAYLTGHRPGFTVHLLPLPASHQKQERESPHVYVSEALDIKRNRIWACSFNIKNQSCHIDNNNIVILTWIQNHSVGNFYCNFQSLLLRGKMQFYSGWYWQMNNYRLLILRWGNAELTIGASSRLIFWEFHDCHIIFQCCLRYWE